MSKYKRINALRLNDLRFYFGASGSLIKGLKRNTELNSYDTDYSELAQHFGAEWFNIGNAPLFWGMWAASNFITDVEHAYVSGDDTNFNSHRRMFSPNVGLRNRLIFSRELALFLDTKGGAGVAYGEYNHGKGFFPLHPDITINPKGQLTLGLEVCRLIRGVCLAPNAFLRGDFSTFADINHNYWAAGGGFDIFFPTEEEVKKVVRVEVKEVIKEVEKRIGVPGPTVYIEKTVKIELPFMFPNDNPDIPLQPQWFVAQNDGKLYGCFSNPQLDHLMRTVYEWVSNSNGQDGKYRIDIHIKGYANDTGENERNRQLSLARSLAAKSYLMADINGELYQSKIRDVASINSENRFREIAMEMGVPWGGWSGENAIGHNICGFQDEHGKRIGSLKELVDAGVVKFINENEELLAKTNSQYSPADDISTDFKVPLGDVTRPKFRTVRFEIEVFKDGVRLEGEELKKFKEDLEVPRKEKLR